MVVQQQHSKNQDSRGAMQAPAAVKQVRHSILPRENKGPAKVPWRSAIGRSAGTHVWGKLAIRRAGCVTCASRMFGLHYGPMDGKKCILEVWWDHQLDGGAHLEGTAARTCREATARVTTKTRHRTLSHNGILVFAVTNALWGTACFCHHVGITATAHEMRKWQEGTQPHVGLAPGIAAGGRWTEEDSMCFTVLASATGRQTASIPQKSFAAALLRR